MQRELTCLREVRATTGGRGASNEYIGDSIPSNAIRSPLLVSPLVMLHGTSQDPLARVVGFRVEPFSVNHKFKAASAYWKDDVDMPPLSTCDSNNFDDPVKFSKVSAADMEYCPHPYDCVRDTR